MADTTINADMRVMNGITYIYCPHQFTVWTSSSVGYAFFINGTVKVQYAKTTDGGSSWGSGVSVLDSGESGNGYIKFGIWFDKWTSGDTGTKIHVVGQDWNADNYRYRTLDTASDTLGTERNIAGSPLAGTGTGYADNGFMSICKARGGNLYVCTFFDTTGAFYRSTDSGVTWSSRSSPFEAAEDLVQVIPANDSDSNDIACVYFDDSADELSFKLYDDSANTWGTETSIGTGIDSGVDWPDDQFMFHAAVRHSDGKAIVAWWNDEDVSTADLKCSVLTLTAGGANATALTDVASNVTEGGGTTSVLIDQNTDDLYVGYLMGGTWESLVDVWVKSSTDDGTTWGSAGQYNTTQDDYRNLSLGTSVDAGDSGRLYPAFIDDDDFDLLGNFDLSVVISAGAAAEPTPYNWNWFTHRPPGRRSPRGQLNAWAGTWGEATAGAFTVNLAGSITPTGVPAKQANKTTTGTVTPAGALLKQTAKAYAGTLVPAGALAVVRVALRSFTGSITPTGAAAKLVTKPLAGTLTPAGALAKQTAKPFAGALTPAGSLVRLVGKLLTGGITPTGALALLRVALRTFTGSITPAGALAKQANKTTAGSITPSGVVRRQANKALTGVITPAGALVKAIAKVVAGSITPAAVLTLSRVVLRSFAGSITPAAVLRRQANKGLTGTITPTGTLRRVVGKGIAATVTPIGALAKAMTRRFVGAITPTGSLVAFIVGTVTVTGRLITLRLDDLRTTVRLDTERTTVELDDDRTTSEVYP